MCLGIPGQVIRMLDGYGGQLALVDVAGEPRKVNIRDAPRGDVQRGRLGDHPHGFRPRKDRRGRGSGGGGRFEADRQRRRASHDAPTAAHLCARRRQGVGFRPFVYTSAAALGLSGSVRNDSSGAIIEVEGDPAAIEDFLDRMTNRPPPLAVVESVQTQNIPLQGGTGFAIADTSHSAGGRTLASPDVAMCDDCAAEQRDPGNRRYRHPFVNCTNCGPASPSLRRCPTTGPPPPWPIFRCVPNVPANTPIRPTVASLSRVLPAVRADAELPRSWRTAARRRRRPAQGTKAVVRWRNSRGQRHRWLCLACDAANDSAVATLRRRQRRGAKPFAVMVPDLTTAHHIADVDDSAAQLLSGIQRPIAVQGEHPQPYPISSHHISVTSASCWRTHHCTRCSSDCRAMNRARQYW